MDSLSTILDTHQGRGAFVLRCEMDAPWSARIADRATLGMVIMRRGGCVLIRSGGEARTLVAGDVAVIRGPDPYTLADDAGTDVAVVIEPGQVCRAPDGSVSAAMVAGSRSWGNAEHGECAFLAAAFELPTQVRGRLLSAVPDLLVLPAGELDVVLVALLEHEVEADRPGQAAMLDRLVDLVLITVLREWFTRTDSDAPRWWSAQTDLVVGRVLTLMHESPQHAWSLQELADRVGYSRATVARRFTELLGQSPMAYLTDWRLTVAADLLRADDASVETIARSVGYANPFAFSTAFKRQFGQSPRHYRQAA